MRVRGPGRPVRGPGLGAGPWAAALAARRVEAVREAPRRSWEQRRSRTWRAQPPPLARRGSARGRGRPPADRTPVRRLAAGGISSRRGGTVGSGRGSAQVGCPAEGPDASAPAPGQGGGGGEAAPISRARRRPGRLPGRTAPLARRTRPVVQVAGRSGTAACPPPLQDRPTEHGRDGRRLGRVWAARVERRLPGRDGRRPAPAHDRGERRRRDAEGFGESGRGGSAWERDEKPEAAVPGAFPESADIPQRGSGIASGPAAVVTVRRGTAPSTLDSSGRRSPARPTIGAAAPASIRRRSRPAP